MLNYTKTVPNIGDFIVVLRKRPKFWQSKIHSFGLYDGDLVVIEKGKICKKSIPTSDKFYHMVQPLPKERKEIANIHLSIGWVDTLQFANMIHGTNHMNPMDFFTIYRIPEDGELELYVEG